MTDPSSKLEEFMCEPRYVVLKRKDLITLTAQQWRQLKEITKVHDAQRENSDRPELEVVVVEADWPEYELLWSAIEARDTKENKGLSNEHQ